MKYRTIQISNKEDMDIFIIFTALDIHNLKFKSYNQKLPKEFGKKMIENIIFNDEFDQIIESGTLPNNLKTLIFGTDFGFDNPENSLQIGSLPESLQTLTFGENFNQTLLAKLLPSQLLKLDLGLKFNKPLQNLPGSLKILILGKLFNQPINAGSLPPFMETLYLSSHFNYPLEVGSLPSTLKTLVMGEKYNFIIGKDIIPKQIHTLQLSKFYSHPIGENTLPGVIKLTLGYSYSCPIIEENIPSVKQIRYHGTNTTVLNSLKSLKKIVFDNPLNKITW
ncbi:hypothetical protein DLAC_10858 [Tieghemostelium lacteum]|uniref:FNIP repeat-containing protein n=1 Tax=Tieghemostelium lacteum TaxID=361077 RepID=A0A151Z3Y4_TIELA|nr:hypothetical protein DLAC_10858 [Tieghemostelium lacteum]|eukprot:KYQ88676.1 hypothetical protein DLAC_10858 [Tieghemostelium lacteum]